MGKTLRMIAEGGKDAFYTGEIAEAMVNVINKYGGVYTMEDFANYEVKVHEPAKGTYRGYEIYSAPLPSSGGTHVVQALNIMENFDIASYGENSWERLHIMSEAFRMIFNDRATYMGDPEYVDVPSKGLVSKSYAAEQAAQITLDKRIEEYADVNPWVHEHEDTTHFSVADADGNIVGVTQTVNGIFGAKIAPKGYGFVLNNEMDDFSSNPESPNAIAPGKTPLSSMSPTIVLREDGTPFMVLGSPGATRIITTVTQLISNAIDYGMDAQQSIDAPRIFNNATSSLSYEDRIPQETIDKLVEMGYEVDPQAAFTRSFGSVNAVLFGEDGKLYGGADPRRDGKAVGY